MTMHSGGDQRHIRQDRPHDSNDFNVGVPARQGSNDRQVWVEGQDERRYAPPKRPRNPDGAFKIWSDHIWMTVDIDLAIIVGNILLSNNTTNNPAVQAFAHQLASLGD